MAQNIGPLQGAYFSAVPAVDLPKQGGGTARFTDVTDTTATAADVSAGKYFFDAAGNYTEGTSTGGGGGFVDVVETLPNGGQHHKISGVNLSNDTVSAEHLETGYTAHDSSGNLVVGTLSPGGGGGGGTPEPCPVTVVGTRNSSYMGEMFRVIALSSDQNDFIVDVGYVRGTNYPLSCYAVPRADSSEEYAYEVTICSNSSSYYEPTFEAGSATNCIQLYSGTVAGHRQLVVGCKKNAYVAIGYTNHN